MSHTPTPWKVVQHNADTDAAYKPVFISPLILKTGDDSRGLPNAEFIVRACNSHDALVDALATAYARLLIIGDWNTRHTADGQRELCLIRDALCLATGREAQDVQEEFEHLAVKGKA